MARKITEKEFLERWKTKKDYTIISEYRGFAENIIVRDKYGELITKPLYLIKNKPLSVLSAIDKTSYTINRFKEKHGDVYNYDKFIYHGALIDSVIICKKHGEFKQSPSNHLRHGCHTCNVSNNGFSRKDFINRGINKISKLYLIECWNNNEKFVKIGITSQSIRNRFIRNRDMPYQYKLIDVIENENASFIFDKEKSIKKSFKSKYYEPHYRFAGVKECYNILYLEELKEVFINIKNENNV